MQVLVEFKPPYSILVGKETDTIALPDRANAGDLRDRLETMGGKDSRVRALFKSATIVADNIPLGDLAPLPPGHKIVVFSPFLGG